MKPPFVVPIHLSGFDQILPEGKWRIPRIFGKRIHIHVGEPFLVEEEFEKHKEASEAAVLAEVTTYIFKKMQALEAKAKLIEEQR